MVGVGVVENGADPLFHPPGSLRFCQPKGQENPLDCGGVNLIDGHIANEWEGVAMERGEPFFTVLVILPAALAVPVRFLGYGAKRLNVRSFLNLPPLGRGIEPSFR
jgi:hypothetical protein